MQVLQRARQELGQLSYTVKQYASIKAIKRQFAAIRQIHFHSALPPVSVERKDLWAITVVKNELDILPHVIDHLFKQGIDKILIADNQSDDGTWEYLCERSSEDKRLLIARDVNPVHAQSEKMTYMAHLAWQRGARWIIPFDGDEFWYAQGKNLKDYFLSTDLSVVYAGFHHTVPTVDSPQDIVRTELVMDSADSFPGKVAFRSHPFVVIIPGNHNVTRLGPRGRGLDILHIQYRGVEQIIRKVRQGTTSSKLTQEDLSWFAPHWEAGSKLTRDEIQEVWQNISNGRPDERIKFVAEGPMRRGRFLQWKSWNDGNDEQENLVDE